MGVLRIGKPFEIGLMGVCSGSNSMLAVIKIGDEQGKLKGTIFGIKNSKNLVDKYPNADYTIAQRVWIFDFQG